MKVHQLVHIRSSIQYLLVRTLSGLHTKGALHIQDLTLALLKRYLSQSALGITGHHCTPHDVHVSSLVVSGT